MNSRVLFRLVATVGLVAMAGWSAGAEKTTAEKTAADLLPDSTVAYLEVQQPQNLIGVILDHPLRQRLEAMLPCEELFVSEFTPVMGAHIGPGLLGIAYWAE